jgi:putative ABC transport system permease protein
MRCERVVKKYNPNGAFDYQFVEEEYAKKFSDEERFGSLSLAFTVFGIFISCLGLFGLSSFLAEQRTKEIGIRKILGASLSNLWRLLSMEYVALAALAFIIAIPISWYLSDQWLQKFEYRTEISWILFLETGVGAVFVTLLTVSYQSMKAALANPVKSLRDE